MKKFISAFLILATVVTTIICLPTFSLAASLPSFSKSKPLKVYTISTGDNTTAYSTSALSAKKGTIYASDEIYVFEITKNSKGKYYAYCSYPISSGRKEAYIPLSVITSATSASTVVTAQTTATTYRRASTSNSFGSISKGDKIYKLTTSGSYTQIIYNVGSASNPTAWKMGWVKTTEYNKLAAAAKSVTTTKTTISSSDWQYPLTSSYVCGNDWNTKYSARPSRPYHVGIDIGSNKGDYNVYAAALGTVKATGFNSANGYYVIIQHSVNGKTVYSFYAHLKSGSITVSSGKSVSKGSKIAVMGNTGSGSSGTHLHFAIVDTLWTGGGYYGYATSTGSKVKYDGVTYYNPHYVIKNGKLPS